MNVFVCAPYQIVFDGVVYLPGEKVKDVTEEAQRWILNGWAEEKEPPGEGLRGPRPDGSAHRLSAPVSGRGDATGPVGRGCGVGGARYNPEIVEDVRSSFSKPFDAVESAY